LVSFFKSENFAGIIDILIGFVFIWAATKFFAKDNFLNSDKFEVFRRLTPFSALVNYWLIKIILGLAAIICFFGGFSGFIRPILNN
jgi:hypothetical protein